MEKDNKNTSIFRKESMDTLSSPEQLKDYIRVSNPPAWLTLMAILILLVGALVWACNGSISVTDADGVIKEVTPITLLMQ
ncbi:MAG: hypothetical protein E7277_07245 [Lachnospiraceae bacterium]|jgi:hypothetical protein|nr:hypothetical protein [Lachnospiraceae bacterium]